MAKASTRTALRKVRQANNATTLSAEQRKNHPTAARQYVIFGGKRGFRTNGRSFESFVAQHG